MPRKQGYDGGWLHLTGGRHKKTGDCRQGFHMAVSAYGRTKFFSTRPVILRGHPLAFFVCLLVPWVGWVYLAYWFLENAGTRVEVTSDAVRESRWYGATAARLNVPLADIRGTDVDPGWFGARWNAGVVSLTIKDGTKVRLSAVESPESLKLLIDKLRA